MAPKVTKRKIRKIVREELLDELRDALSTVRIGYPYYCVPRTIQRAIRYIREQQEPKG